MPVGQSGPDWTDAQLIVDSPRLRKPIVLRVIKDCDMCHVIASVDLHANVDPDCSLAFGASVDLT